MGIRSRRLATLRNLLQQQPLHSQEAIAAALRRQGIEATQATLSRDLRELGVLKGPEGYTLPGAEGGRNGHAGKEVQWAVQSYLLSATPAGSLAVLRTGPGQASALALELDRAGLPESVGTIAGDDTVFIATPNAAAATRLIRRLEGLASA
jgi:transcriptional regulator of arginine metabolism